MFNTCRTEDVATGLKYEGKQLKFDPLRAFRRSLTPLLITSWTSMAMYRRTRSARETFFCLCSVAATEASLGMPDDVEIVEESVFDLRLVSSSWKQPGRGH